MSIEKGTQNEILLRCAQNDLNGISGWALKNKIFIGDPHLLSWPGASCNLINAPKIVREFLLDDLNMLVRAKNVQRIIIVHHNNCLAYISLINKLTGLSKEEISAEMEKEIQINDMLKAMTLLGKIFPRMEVILVWANVVKGGGETKKVSFKRIE